MMLLLKMQRTPVTFSLRLTLKEAVPGIQMRKGTWYYKTFEKCGKIRKIKILMQTVWLIQCSRAYFSPLKTWKIDRVQVPIQN